MNYITLPEIGHVGYLVKDVDLFAKGFAAYFNLEKFVIYDFIPQRAWSYGKEIFDCKFRIALFTPDHGAKIELVEYVSGSNTPHEKFIIENGSGIHHIAYYVDNYEQCRDFFQSIDGGQIIFEAVIEDRVLGKRSSFYAIAPGYPSIIEISKKPKK